MVGGWMAFIIVFVIAIALGTAPLALFSLIYLALGALATYMWYHG